MMDTILIPMYDVGDDAAVLVWADPTDHERMAMLFSCGYRFATQEEIAGRFPENMVHEVGFCVRLPAGSEIK